MLISLYVYVIQIGANYIDISLYFVFFCSTMHLGQLPYLMAQLFISLVRHTSQWQKLHFFPFSFFASECQGDYCHHSRCLTTILRIKKMSCIHICVCVCTCMHAKLLQFCLTFCDPMDCSLPGSSLHRILQVRILEWVAMLPPRDLTHPGIDPVSLTSSVLAGRFFTTRSPGKPIYMCVCVCAYNGILLLSHKRVK